jgi:geranylgeranyl diphosphate synthase, type I
MLTEELKKVKAEVDRFLKSFFEEKKKGIGGVHSEVRKMIEDIEDVTLRGGDRFRPFMTYLGWLINQNIDSMIDKNLQRLMCSVELLHSFALIHDDIIDRAEKRRGGPTIKPNEKAILAGDLCFTFADELLNDFSIEVKKEYDVLREEVVSGEFLDVWFARESWENPAKKHNIRLIHEYKTARYSFVRPFMMGGLSAGVRHDDHLQKILINIGVAFQMQDDYLDLFGDERLGKQIGGDIREGNLTIFHEKFVERKNDFDFPKYVSIWHKENINEKEIGWIKIQVEKLGIKKQIALEMQELVESAKEEIEKLQNLNPKAKKLLSEMADFVVKREY